MFRKNRIFTILICLSLLGCQNKNQTTIIENKPNVNREVEQGLVLYNATLEQSNADGKTLWKLSTEKVVYTQDKKIATLENLTGNLFENGKIILKVSAKKGEIRNDGKEIFLKDNILALDTRNKAEFKGDSIEWKPEENYLIVQQNFKVNHPKLTMTAQQAKYNTQNQIVEVSENILANMKNPQLHLKTQHLYWKISEEKIIGDRSLLITRYDDKIVTDKLTTQQAEVDLNSNIAVIQGNIEYQSLKPPLQAATNRILWNYQERKMEANQPIQLVQTEDKMTLTANLAKLNLAENNVYLEGGIYGEAVGNEAKIYADNLTWNLDEKQITANSNVYYQQLNPDFNLRGTKAVGKLQEKNITVTGDDQNKVITIIYPDQ